MKIEISKTAFKAMKKIDKKYQKIILEKIKLLEDYPDTPNIKKLTNHYPPYRFRVGDYRVLFDVEDEVIKILDVKHRKEAY